jgi:hypothetical protein
VKPGIRALLRFRSFDRSYRVFDIPRQASHSIILEGQLSTGDPGFFVGRSPNPCPP